MRDEIYFQVDEEEESQLVAVPIHSTYSASYDARYGKMLLQLLLQNNQLSESHVSQLYKLFFSPCRRLLTLPF